MIEIFEAIQLCEIPCKKKDKSKKLPKLLTNIIVKQK